MRKTIQWSRPIDVIIDMINLIIAAGINKFGAEGDLTKNIFELNIYGRVYTYCPCD